MDKNKHMVITLRTLAYCIEALDSYIVDHIEDINDSVKYAADSTVRDELLMLLEEHLYVSARELKQAYEEELKLKKISNYPPYNQLVTEHPKVIID